MHAAGRFDDVFSQDAASRRQGNYNYTEVNLLYFYGHMIFSHLAMFRFHVPGEVICDASSASIIAHITG